MYVPGAQHEETDGCADEEWSRRRERRVDREDSKEVESGVGRRIVEIGEAKCYIYHTPKIYGVSNFTSLSLTDSRPRNLPDEQNLMSV